MNLPRLAAWLFPILLDRVASQRRPDFIIGADSPGGAYLHRWYLTTWRAWYRDVPEAQRTRWQRFAVAVSHLLPNLYLHCFARDDDDRALHDHPSWAASFILHGAYLEHTIAAGGIHTRTRHEAGSLRFLPTRHTHRVELYPAWWMEDDFDSACDQHAQSPDKREPCWTLFLFGPTVREWGFHCPDRGWVHWKEFTAAGKPGEIGPGCGA
jgi:hypothetical protein